MCYNEKQCQSSVRRTIIDDKYRRITVVGKHAFQWSIMIYNKSNNAITTYTYTNRISCLKDFI